MIILDKLNLVIQRYRNAFRYSTVLCVIFWSGLLWYSFYTSHGYYLEFVIIKEELTWETFTISLDLIEKLLIKLFNYFSLKIHVCFVILFLIVSLIDTISALAILFLYVSGVLTCGLDIELRLLTSTVDHSLISAIWFRIDFCYSDEYLKAVAEVFWEKFNIAHKTKYDMIEETSLLYLIQESKGKASIVVAKLWMIYKDYHKKKCQEKQRRTPWLIRFVRWLTTNNNK